MEVEAPRRPPQEAPSSSTSSSTERKDLDKNKETQQSKAEDANTAHMERKSESSSHRRKDSKDGARSSHEPPAPTPQEERAREENEESNPCPRHDRPPSTSVAATQTEDAIPPGSPIQVVVSPRPKRTPRGERGRSSSLRQPLLGQPPTQTRRQSRQARKAKKEAEMLAKYEGCSFTRAINSAGIRWLTICAAIVFMWTLLPKQPTALPREGPSHLPHESPSGLPHEPSHEEDRSSHRGAVPPKPEESELKLAQKKLKDELAQLADLEEKERKTERVENLARLSQKVSEDEARSQNNKELLRQAALDAEVQAKLAMEELQEDQDIKHLQAKVKMQEEKIDDLEASAKGESPAQKSP